MSTLSAVVLTHNTESTIADVIRSLDKVADEIIVMDDYSTDKTINIIKRTTKKAKIVKNKFRSYTEQRRIGDSKTTGDWIAWVDDDEVWDDELIEEVRKIKQDSEYDGYELSFKTPVLGNVVEYEWHLRLFRRGKGKGTNAFHTKVQMNSGARVRKLKRGHVVHLTWEGVDAWLKKHSAFPKIDIDNYRARGLNISPWKMLAMFFVVFFRRIKLLKYGTSGLVWNLAASTSWFFKAAYLVEQKKKKQKSQKKRWQ